MHIFKNETVPCKEEIFSDDASSLLSNKNSLFFSVSNAFSLVASGSDMFLIGIGFGIAGGKVELRNSFKLLSFLLFLFTFTN